MAMTELTVDGIGVSIEPGSTILEAAHSAGVYVPTLCYHPSLASDGSCGLCLVEVEGSEELPLACVAPVEAGMVVRTDTPRLREQQRNVLRQLLASHPCACLTCWRRERCQPFDICLRNVAVSQRCVSCPRNGRCELQMVVDYIGLGEDFAYTERNLPVYRDNPFFDRDYNLCIGCGRCVRVCREVRGIEALSMVDYEELRIPQPSDGKSLLDSGCKLCCACVEVCPTGALVDKEARWNERFEPQAVTNPCRYACPAGIDVPLYVNLIAEGKHDAALGVIRERVPFPGVLGRVCIHPCETACRRGSLNEPIAVKFLKRFVADRDSGRWRQFSRALAPTGKKVAVVGSGPAGLTAAYYLVKVGHAVTVFEQFPQAGGMMRVGIPRYRLPAEVLDAEIGEIERAGVEIKLNTRVESIDDLLVQGYSATFLALGTHSSIKTGMAGEDTPGVLDGVAVLRDVSLDRKVELGDRVAVIGGGNVAIDCARTALRLGARDVSIYYRRTRAEMPASPEEVEATLEENVKMVFLAAPVRVSQKANGRLDFTCVRAMLGEADASGRRRPVPIKGSEFSVECDSVIAAVGQVADVSAGFGLKLGRGNTIRADSETLATSRDGVYAGGDVVIGPASVIEAIAAGRRAASAIDKYLGGSGEIDEVLAPDRQYNLCVGKEDGFISRTRAEVPALDVAGRVSSFTEVELGFSEEAAVGEARRCLQCAVRCHLKPVSLPPVPADKPEEVRLSV